MNEKLLRAALRDIPLGGFRFYAVTGSTNDVALAWATEGARDLSLVVADEQTSGRGRGGRTWFTSPGSALAFSLVLRPQAKETAYIPLFTALGAMAVVDALERSGLAPIIKWPNDVLLDQRKVCGILTEVVWLSQSVDSLVLGIGINVSKDSQPTHERFAFPATSIESIAQRRPDRSALLREVLLALLEWRPRLGTQEFIRTWEQRLAFRGEKVTVLTGAAPGRTGWISGLEQDGNMRLVGMDGNFFTVQAGEVHLRPVL